MTGQVTKRGPSCFVYDKTPAPPTKEETIAAILELRAERDTDPNATIRRIVRILLEHVADDDVFTAMVLLLCE